MAYIHSDNVFSEGSEYEQLQAWVKDYVGDIVRMFFVARPAEITKIYDDKPIIDCQIIEKYKVNGVLKDFPILERVLLFSEIGGKYTIQRPLSIGDKGIILFLDRSTEHIKYSESIPNIFSLPHNINNGIFFPGVSVFNDTFNRQNQEFKIESKENITIKGDKKLKIEIDSIDFLKKTEDINTQIMDVIDQIKNLITSIKSEFAAVAGKVGGYPTTIAVATIPIESALDTAKININQIKSDIARINS